MLAIPFSAALAANETLTLSWTIQDGTGSNLGSPATWRTGSAVVATGPAGGGTVTGCFKIPVPMGGARQSLGGTVTPNLSRAGTDTAQIAGVWVCGGAGRLPQ